MQDAHAARLVVLTDTTQYPDPLSSLASLLGRARAGSVVFVLRDKQLPVRERLALGLRLRALCHLREQSFVVAERADLARLLEADGVHLPVLGVPPSKLRAVLPQAWLSRAHHADEALPNAELDALSAVFVSPVCASRKGRAALGVDGFGRLARELHGRRPFLNVYALGGVGPEHVPGLLAAGAAGVAVIGAGHAADPEPLLSSLGILR